MFKLVRVMVSEDGSSVRVEDKVSGMRLVECVMDLEAKVVNSDWGMMPLSLGQLGEVSAVMFNVMKFVNDREEGESLGMFLSRG
jgi:hypothetical protein